jgi:hypothetical protein
MIKLIGRSGIDVGVFDLAVPSLTLGDVVINGADNNLFIGSGFEATEKTLKINTEFEFNADSSPYNFGQITFRSIYLQFYDATDAQKFILSVDGNQYFFGTDSNGPLFSTPVGGSLQVQGLLCSNNILPSGTNYNIGSDVLRYKNIYADTIFSNNLETQSEKVSFIYPLTALCGIEIGSLGNIDNIRIRAKTFKLYNNSDAIPTIDIYENAGNPYLRLGDVAGSYGIEVKTSDLCGLKVYSASDAVNPVFSTNNSNIWMNRTILFGPNVNIGDSSFKANNFYANNISIGCGSFSDTLNTHDIMPSVYDAYDIGSNALSFKNIYTGIVNSRKGLISDSTTEWYICGPNMQIKVNGESRIGICAAYIEMYKPLYTNSIFPIESTGKFIGSLCGGGFEAIYLRDQTTGNSVRVYVDSGVLHP